MKKQVVVIHGGTSFKSYEDYISYLKNMKIDLERLKPHRSWREKLVEELENYEVLVPRMPNKTNAKYKEWKIWFENIAKILAKEVILIGHSLGGIFLAKYLSENIFPQKIKAVILIAAPYDDEDIQEDGESLSDFSLPLSLKKFQQQAEKIYLIYSQDDPVVSFSNLEKYKKALPGARTLIFKNRQHFNQETFSEIIELIRRL